MKAEQASYIEISHLVLSVTGLLLALLMLLGLSLQLGWRHDTPGKRLARWPHHALFFAVCLSLGLAALVVWHSGGCWWALLPALTLLLSMPRTKPGRADHWQRALACASAFGLGAWGAW